MIGLASDAGSTGRGSSQVPQEGEEWRQEQRDHANVYAQEFFRLAQAARVDASASNGTAVVHLPDYEHAQALQCLRRMTHAARRVGASKPGEGFASDSRQMLLSAGVRLMRMGYVSEKQRSSLQRTLTLLGLALFCDAPETPESRDACKALGAGAAEAGAPEAGAPEPTDAWAAENWGSELRTGPEAPPAARAHAESLRARELQDCAAFGIALRSAGLTEAQALQHSLCYFCCAGRALQGAALRAAPPERFVEGRALLDVMGDPRALSLAESADADLGQQVYRDLIMSFSVPRGRLGWRRQLPLERAVHKIVESEFADVQNRAYNAANQSPSHVWQHGLITEVRVDESSIGEFLEPPHYMRGRATAAQVQESSAAADSIVHEQDPSSLLERSCALLAGLAISLCSSANAVEETRKGDAFRGLVELPFLQVEGGRESGPTRVALVQGEWFAYSVQGSALRVRVRGAGLGALLECACELLGRNSPNSAEPP
jgi:hypothetical protein